WGNPVLLARKLFAPVTRLGGDAGARKLLHGRTDVRVLDVDDPAILVDADTPSALAEMRRRVEKNPPYDEMSSPAGRSRHSRPSGPKGREGKQARHSRPSDPKDREQACHSRPSDPKRREGKGNHIPPRRS
ncbi:MAG: hypothetical protein JOY76_00305, partial [Hyphomicrobiales bacterium]|nr:hypothetical protein [Hyphomicrobiales bacterium]